MLPSRLKSKLRSELGFIAAELAILVVLLIGLASGSVLVQQSQNPEKKAAISLLSCNSGNCYQDCICQGNTPGECNAGCLPTPKPTESYTCNGDCIPDGENCWRSGTGTCQSNFFCCKQQDPDPTATPFYTPTRAPTRTPTRVPTNTPTKIPTRTPTPACSPLGRKKCGGLDRNGNSCGTSGINVCYSNGWICTDCPGNYSCNKRQNKCVSPTPALQRPL